MDQIEQDHATNGNVLDTDGSQANVGQEQLAGVQDNSQGNTLIQPTVVQSPQQFSQTAVSVIQPAQASVIQTTTSSAQQIQQLPQAIQFQGVIDHDDLDEEGKKRRDILSRRPSYRKIYDDLSDGSIKVEDENGQVMARVATISAGAISDQTSTQTVTIPQGIQITTQGGAFSATSLQTVPISGQSATIVQYPTGQNGQEGQFIYAAAPGDVEGVNNATVYAIPTSQAYAVRSQLSPGVVLSPGTGPIGSEDATRKREMRLLKNREAAKECRRKKKEYVKCLENRVAVLENQNKTLIEELKALKDLYCHKAD